MILAFGYGILGPDWYPYGMAESQLKCDSIRFFCQLIKVVEWKKNTSDKNTKFFLLNEKWFI